MKLWLFSAFCMLFTSHIQLVLFACHQISFMQEVSEHAKQFVQLSSTAPLEPWYLERQYCRIHSVPLILPIFQNLTQCPPSLQYTFAWVAITGGGRGAHVQMFSPSPNI